MKKNVLVFPCGSEIGLEIYNSLRYSIHINVIGASSTDDHGQYVYEHHIGGVPFVDSPDFVEGINRIVRENEVDFILPAHDSVLLKLSQAEDEGKLEGELVASPAETCEVARSKKKTYDFLQDIIPIPKVYSSIDSIPADAYPVFLKPDVGQGSKGTQLAKSSVDANFYIQKDPSLLILEFLPGKEYTVDCFTSSSGELLVSEGRERQRISNGISVNSYRVNDDRFTALAEKINSKLRFRGAWFYQVKERAEGELVLMEIAPRIAGTMGLIRCTGVNLPLLSLFDRLGYKLDIFSNSYNITIDRALKNRYKHDIKYGHVYLDFDDLLLFDDKVNPLIIAFVYQCINNDIKVHLLTKHKADLDETLKKYRLANVFDEVIWIRDEKEKPDHITEKDAIFIDDSFAERKLVHDRCNIPVFDSHMLESLMERF